MVLPLPAAPYDQQLVGDREEQRAFACMLFLSRSSGAPTHFVDATVIMPPAAKNGSVPGALRRCSGGSDADLLYLQQHSFVLFICVFLDTGSVTESARTR